MSHIDAMKQALEYLQDNQHLIADNERHAYVMEYNAFIERFEQAIAEAEKQPAPAQEPVAHCKVRPLQGNESFPNVQIDWVSRPVPGPLYTTPPAPAQRPLTDEAFYRLVRIMGTFDLATGHADSWDELFDSLESELRDVLGHLRTRREWVGLTDEEFIELCSADMGTAALIRAVEAKLKEKNGG